MEGYQGGGSSPVAIDSSSAPVRDKMNNVMDLIQDHNTAGHFEKHVLGNGYGSANDRAVVRRWKGPDGGNEARPGDGPQCFVMMGKDLLSYVGMTRDQLRAFGIACVQAANWAPGDDEDE